ncbi:hypothetical protein QA601_12575 [Chitinispirillales bacterium ANBcel5]|uniref:hypothetical protein n=1 Tax=Cellulosispirillum alkaliphilum TaxID=3039283 RepID=UPI002A501228|nr:hypothetical protein [Chitinispirillales bacterium ANBcel5]
MKITIVIFLLTTIVIAQKKFDPDHFIQKHDLNLPKVTDEMLDVSNHTHKSDSWFYFYKDDSDMVDSVFRFLNIEGFPPNKRYEDYLHRNDSSFINSVSISKEDLDTTSNYHEIRYDNSILYINHQNRCSTLVTYNSWGQRKSEKRKCPDDEEFSGVRFSFTPKEEFVQSIRFRDNKIDSSLIRWYYFTPFDSVVAEYTVSSNTPPLLLGLFTYTPFNRRQFSFDFDTRTNINQVVRFNYYTYNNNKQLHRIYFFRLKQFTVPEDGFVLTNYTEYTYDSLGRKTSMITRVVPDKEGESE